MNKLVVPGDGFMPAREQRKLARQFAAQLERTGKTGQMVYHKTNFARVYVYAGEWVADCPRTDCGNTILMTNKDARDRGVAWTPYERIEHFLCGYCGYETNSVHWPKDAAFILDVLDCRPIPHTRNWYPEGHITAVKSGTPDGQTVADLIRENAEHGVSTRFEILQMLEGGDPPRLGLPR